MSSYLEYQKLDIGSVCAWRICAFQAGQESELQPAIVKPEGRIFFAGDHTTLYHGWIQGAIESGIFVAMEVNE